MTEESLKMKDDYVKLLKENFVGNDAQLYMLHHHIDMKTLKSRDIYVCFENDSLMLVRYCYMGALHIVRYDIVADSANKGFEYSVSETHTVYKYHDKRAIYNYERADSIMELVEKSVIDGMPMNAEANRVEK